MLTATIATGRAGGSDQDRSAARRPLRAKRNAHAAAKAVPPAGGVGAAAPEASPRATPERGAPA